MESLIPRIEMLAESLREPDPDSDDNECERRAILKR